MLSGTLPERGDDPDKLNISAKYIFDTLSSFGNPLYQDFDVWGLTYRNVVLNLGPKEGNAIIIGAHYDTAGGLPGADDNASGVAGLLELARLLSQQSLSKPIELVAYSLEEPPYFGTHDMGSYHHAAGFKTKGGKLELMISLEAIGYFDDSDDSQKFPIPVLSLIYPKTGNFIAIIGRIQEIGIVRKIKKLFRNSTDLPVYSLTVPPIIPAMTFSDHRNYWIHDYKAIMITDTAFLRNPNYHKPTDTADTLDYLRMTSVVEGVYGIIMGLME